MRYKYFYRLSWTRPYSAMILDCHGTNKRIRINGFQIIYFFHKTTQNKIKLKKRMYYVDHEIISTIPLNFHWAINQKIYKDRNAQWN